MSKALLKAIEKQTFAEDHVRRVLLRDYPRLTPIRWQRNGFHRGWVVDHNMGVRIKVRNERTQRELWITAYDILPEDKR